MTPIQSNFSKSLLLSFLLTLVCQTSFSSPVSGPFVPESVREVLKSFLYSSLEGKVKMKFPAEYGVEVSPGESHTTTKISAEHNGMNYFLSYTIHETPIDKHYEMANISLDAFRDKLNARSISEGDYQYKSYKGRTAEMMLDEQGIRLYYRAILVGQIQYQIIVTQEGTSSDRKMVDIFFKSFKLLK